MPAYRNPPWAGPPAPLVDLHVRWGSRATTAPILAILDSGADQTQIPLNVAVSLLLRKISDKAVNDANGQQQLQPIYAANLEFDSLRFDNIAVIGSPLRIALIGRDILNRLAVLDGPRLTYSLTPLLPIGP